MGLPSKRRTPRSKRERASHFALKATGVTKCADCGSAMLPHRACPGCGKYRGKQGVNKAKRADRARRKTTRKS